MSINTHNLIIDFGKYKGEKWTRLPINYLKWLINEGSQYTDIAKSELSRRGIILDNELEISKHALDRASLKCRKVWYRTRKDKEGLYSWLYRTANEALKKAKKREKIMYNNIVFVFNYGDIYPVLVTVYNLAENKRGGNEY